MYGHVPNFGLVTLPATLLVGATSFSLTTGDDANLPQDGGDTNPPFFLCAWNSESFGSPLLTDVREVMLVTAATGVSMGTVVRGQEGTSARQWPAGTKMMVVQTESMLEWLYLIQEAKEFFRFDPDTGEPSWKGADGTWLFLRPVQVGDEWVANFEEA